jgi:FtsZ-binding cell division protein ZapB
MNLEELKEENKKLMDEIGIIGERNNDLQKQLYKEKNIDNTVGSSQLGELKS